MSGEQIEKLKALADIVNEHLMGQTVYGLFVMKMQDYDKIADAAFKCIEAEEKTDVK